MGGGVNARGSASTNGSLTATTTAAATAAGAAAGTSGVGRGQPQPTAIETPTAYGLVVGLGDPVSDILVRLEDDSVASRVFTTCGIDEPGGCLPVDTDDDIQQLLAVCSGECIDGAGDTDQSADDANDGGVGGVGRGCAVAEPVYCPGGSAANVMKGIANLGGEAAFVGMVGRDEVGRRYRELLAAQNVRPVLLEASIPPRGDAAPGGEGEGQGGDASSPSSPQQPNSAQCLSLVEKDGQRTMRTYLGASLCMGAADFPEEEALTGAKLLHIEGYTLYRPELAVAAMKAAKARGALVSLDLASFEVVRNCRAQLLQILESGVVDLLFANEDEAQELMSIAVDHHKNIHDRPLTTSAPAAASDLAPAPAPADAEDEEAGEHFTRRDADRAMAWMLRYCRVATVSMGPRGCVTSNAEGHRGVAPGISVPVVDTTGAGDSFTAGFLHAYLSGATLQACASCGCAVGTQVGVARSQSSLLPAPRAFHPLVKPPSLTCIISLATTGTITGSTTISITTVIN